MNSSLMREAISNPEFCSYFKRCGGGYELTNHPLITEQELIERFCMNEDDFLAIPRRLWPTMPDGKSATAESVAHMTESELIDLRNSAPLAPKDNLKNEVKIRNLQRAKVWRFYVGFIHNVGPYHPQTNLLLKGEFSELWERDYLLERAAA